MKQLLIVKDSFILPGAQPGDIIGVFSDVHKFTDREVEMFDIVLVDEKELASMDQQIADYLNEDPDIARTIERRYYESGALKWH